MSVRSLDSELDADVQYSQFRRAVEIVQGLPKTGPIQTGYEEKLAMYSLYKQATVGNVKTPRPGLWDMLGRAKWDAWAKHKDLPQHEAKWLYVETLLKVLRKYSSQTVAMDLVRELESFQGDPDNLVLSGSYMSSRRRSSSDSGDSSDDGHPSAMPQPFAPQPVPAHLLNNQRQPAFMRGREATTTDEDTDGEEVPPPVTRPLSSVSSAHRYRTPMATSTGVPAAFSPPPPVPELQPLPRFSSSSAFSPTLESMPTGSLPSSSYPTSLQYPTGMSRSSGSGAPTPQSYPSVSLMRGSPAYGPMPYRPAGAGPDVYPYLALEDAVQKVQASVAALHERLDVLEAGGRPSRLLNRSYSSVSPTGDHDGNPDDARRRGWDAQRYGAWALVLDPLTNALRATRTMLAEEHASPVLLIVRRLMLDASFVVFVLWLLRQVWRRSRARQRQLLSLISSLLYLIAGRQRGVPQRIMVDRGV
ncbi:ACBP-domain-containing protein [Exidia glandulosa HHB12029]|uniref:ACBP-domain-containing protein n=1 Tax=Exidia glandulosa HHB12029 TaxID=1314781 RepID=A0A165GH85_EXIGL|nr:ACBP-domain-containing protein [Exidia glandulosa HHB12029]